MKIGANKTLVVSMSLLLALSSCGKSKELKTNGGAASPTPTAEPVSRPEPVTAVPPKPVAATPGSLPGAPTPAVTPGFPNGNIGNNNLIPQQPESALNDNEVLPPLPVSPFQNQGGQSNVLNPPLTGVQVDEGRAYQVDFTNQVAVKTGGQSKELFYTSAGRDGLMEEFKTYTTKVSKEQQVLNQSLAKAVVTAKLTRQTSSGEIAITMTFAEGTAINTYKVKATSDGDLMRLSLNRAGTTGEMEFQGGFLKCLDSDGGCENAYAKMKFSGGYTRVIFRNSLADMHFQYQENVVNNPGFNLWMTYIMNSINSVPTSQVFDSLQMSSYEVVNGRAGMGALLTTQDKEMLGLSIPLVVSGQLSQVDAAVAKLSDLAANYDLSSQASRYSQTLSKNVSSAKLIYNNGMGQIKLNLNLGGDQIWLVASRVQKQIISIEQIRNFENKVKAF